MFHDCELMPVNIFIINSSPMVTLTWYKSMKWVTMAYMMTLSNGIIFHVTGPLWEFPGHRWIPLTKASEAFIISLICALTNGWANHRDASELRHHRGQYDVSVMNWCLYLFLWYCLPHEQPPDYNSWCPMPEGRPPLWDRDWGPGGPRRHCPQEGLHPAPHEDTSDVWAAHSGTGEGCGLSLRLTLKDWNMQYIISTYDQKWYWFSNNDVESKYVGGLIKLACSKWHFQIVYKYSGDGLTKSHYLNHNDVHCRAHMCH